MVIVLGEGHPGGGGLRGDGGCVVCVVVDRRYSWLS